MLLLICLFQTEQLRLDKVTLQIQCTYMLPLKFDFTLKFFNPGSFSISFVF